MPTLLWLWCRPTAAARIQPLVWKFPYTVGMALKSKKKKRREKERQHMQMEPGKEELLNELNPCPDFPLFEFLLVFPPTVPLPRRHSSDSLNPAQGSFTRQVP